MIAFKVTRDKIGGNLKGRGFSAGVKLPPDEQMTLRWRVKDDDGNVYFEGIAMPQEDGEPDELDVMMVILDYFLPGYGCTSIDEYVDGSWRVVIG